MAEENTTVTFSCQATGIPSPSISWYRNGSVLSPATDSRISIGISTQQLQITRVYQVTRNITITNITSNDSGFYSCVGTNAYGNGSSAFTLIVQRKSLTAFHNNIILYCLLSIGPPRVMLVASVQSVSEHTLISFTCTVTDLIEPNVTWSHDTVTLSSLITGVQISQTEQGDQITSQLTIASVDRDYAGQFTCTATNQIGSFSNTTTLSVRCELFRQQYTV